VRRTIAISTCEFHIEELKENKDTQWESGFVRQENMFSVKD
jgi:hypothetical protein